jgi:hypothetical protein
MPQVLLHLPDHNVLYEDNLSLERDFMDLPLIDLPV